MESCVDFIDQVLTMVWILEATSPFFKSPEKFSDPRGIFLNPLSSEW